MIPGMHGGALWRHGHRLLPVIWLMAKRARANKVRPSPAGRRLLSAILEKLMSGRRRRQSLVCIYAVAELPGRWMADRGPSFAVHDDWRTARHEFYRRRKRTRDRQTTGNTRYRQLNLSIRTENKRHSNSFKVWRQIYITYSALNSTVNTLTYLITYLLTVIIAQW